MEPDMCGEVYDLSQHDPKVRRALEIVRALGRSSTAKYKSMKDWMARNGRVYGGLLYHGASTGRWSGKGVQPHNFPKPTQHVDVDDLWKTLKRGRREDIMATYRSVMEALANALRGAITASKGNVLYVADYAGIEARVLLWLAGEEEALEMFRQGLDIYCDMAESIYGYPCNKKDHPAERALGKVGILGLGFQLGSGGFERACAVNPELKAKGIVVGEELAQQTVDAYRAKYWRVVALWKEQETAAMKAVQTGKRVFAGRMVWFVQGRFLYCQLPSGRKLAYAYPEVKLVEMPWGAQKESLTFMAVHPKTKKWVRQKTYGGCLVENITQAVARDLMAYGMWQAEKSEDYRVVLSIHDELVAECPKGHGSVHAFEQLMATLPDWGEGCPVTAEGWTGFRYKKG
jgi:DNA polymerase